MPIEGGEVDREQFARIINHQIQFEAKTPAHRAFAASSNPLKDFVLIDAGIVADGDEGGIHKADPAALP